MTSVRSFDAVVIGASAGAIEALSAILPSLPCDWPVPVVVVVHLPPRQKSSIVELFQAKCAVKVKAVEDKERLEAGTVYFAPPNYHVLVEKDHRLSLSGEEAVHFSRPSIDVLFESAALAYSKRLLGIVLTGANSDGAHGLRSILDAGGLAIVQTPGSAIADAMPKAALEACPKALSLDVPSISSFLTQMTAEEPMPC